jgi:hypothetical protein
VVVGIGGWVAGLKKIRLSQPAGAWAELGNKMKTINCAIAQSDMVIIFVQSMANVMLVV